MSRSLSRRGQETVGGPVHGRGELGKMPPRRERSEVSIRELLPKLLAERGESQRQFSEAIGFGQAYLSRVLGGQRAPSLRLLEAVTKGLGLPKDYFPEYREQVVIEAIKEDGGLRDKIYDSLARKRR